MNVCDNSCFKKEKVYHYIAFYFWPDVKYFNRISNRKKRKIFLNYAYRHYIIKGITFCLLLYSPLQVCFHWLRSNTTIAKIFLNLLVRHNLPILFIFWWKLWSARFVAIKWYFLYLVSVSVSIFSVIFLSKCC